MRAITVWQCDLCDFQTSNKEEMIRHEAKHFGLSPEEYTEWSRLHKDAEKAGYAVGVRNCPETRNTFDEAIRCIVEFEKQHGLDEVKVRPFGPYYMQEEIRRTKKRKTSANS